MFTGIIEEVGEVVSVAHSGDSAVLTLRATRIVEDVSHGASIAVDGVCLTVVGWRPPDGGDGTQDDTLDGTLDVAFDVMGETLTRTALGARRAGDPVNLERALPAHGRLDGHVVQGHVDGTGVLVSRVPGDVWHTVRFGLGPELARFVAEKGSIAVDGISLTVTAVGPDWFEVGLIPETLRATTLGSKAAGDPVNLEVDVLAKYVARLLDTTPPSKDGTP